MINRNNKVDLGMQQSLYFDRLSGIEFEEYLLRVFKKLGCEGMVTQASGDFGADLLVKKDGETIVVQAKRYSDPVGISAVQEIIGAKSYYSASKCIVVTTSSFTPSAVALARASGVELWNRQRLIEMIAQSFGSTVDAFENPKTPTASAPAKPLKSKELDPLIQKAILIITKHKQASISILQRQLRIGYTRAAELIEQMEMIGIIGEYERLTPRKVLVTKKEAMQMVRSL